MVALLFQPSVGHTDKLWIRAIFGPEEWGSLKIYAGAGFQEIEGYVMSMFSVDAKISFPVSSRMECEVVAGSRNFNEYLYHTLAIRMSYDLKKKAIPNK